LRISEVNYHPHDAEPNAGELAADDNDFEFIELVNAHASRTLSLAGAQFVEGVQFEFAGSQVTELLPGERVVIVRNIEAFESRYGSGILVAGEFSGSLSNDGETLRLVDALGAPIQEFTYNDAPPWPATPDGLGGTLVAINVAGDYDSPVNWQSSTIRGGTPGAAEPTATLDGDYNGNGTVEQADLDLVLLYWGQVAENAPPAWTNGRPVGFIDQAELDAVLLNWGASLSQPAAARVDAATPAHLESADRSAESTKRGQAADDSGKLARQAPTEESSSKRRSQDRRERWTNRTANAKNFAFQRLATDL
jgi:hypothetical protein